MKLYTHPLSGNAYKAELLLNHLGVEFEKVNTDIFKGEHQTGEFAALNPNRKIPVLVDGDFVMWESNALLFYIGRKFAPNPYFPEEPETFGLASQWVLFGKTTLDTPLALARFWTKFLPPEKVDPAALAQKREEGRAALEILNGALKSRDFLAGPYTIADIACYPYVALAHEGEVDISDYSAVSKWVKRVEAQPGWTAMG
ncbi:MAG: glutathione S-transferase family protein [Candidatus Dadabacteria bacterium]|nr:glutathione S-transferase family protein [Candidatus Dadabacteria bacterium]